MPTSQAIGYRTERGSWPIVSQAIASLTNHTELIPLTRSDHLFGVVLVQVPSSVASYPHRTSRILATIIDTEAVAESTRIDSKTFRGYGGRVYTFTNWAHKGYHGAVDGRLSDSWFHATGGWIRIQAALIVGSNLELTFRNTHTSASGVLTVDIDYRMSRRQP